jgi:hypothetical protein
VSAFDIEKAAAAVPALEPKPPTDSHLPLSTVPVLVTLADIQVEAIEWVWPGRIALGKITLIIGDPGLGKSYLTADLGARVSTGRAWPDGAIGGAAVDAIVLSAEDGIADTIKPRVLRQGGDDRRVHVLEAVRDASGARPFQIGRDLAALEHAVQTKHARMVTIDPFSAYLGRVDSHKDGEVRGLLAPLAAFAASYRVGIVGIMHLTKEAQRRLIARATGSIAFAAAARIVLAVGADPDDATRQRRFFVTVKNNLGAHAPGLTYTITDDGLCWGAEPLPGTLSAEALLDTAAVPASREDTGQRAEAERFLEDLLAHGPVPSTQVMKDLRANGIAEKTARRAKRDLKIRAERIPRGTGPWFWCLP